MTQSQFDTRRVSIEDDLATLVAQINGAYWDEDNAMSHYDVASLAQYLERQDTLFMACFSCSDTPVLQGIASGRLELKPYAGERWLYVDEVDVCVDCRQRGVGLALMNALLAIAQSEQCEEVWLGAEADNEPANALYRALQPDDVAAVIGYTYETDG